MESVERKIVIEDDVDESNELTATETADQRPLPRTIEGFSLEDGAINEFLDCRNATFTGPVRFRNVFFPEGFNFDGATFESTVTFVNVTVATGAGKKSVFSNCKFRRKATFQRSTLYLADFTGSTFEGSVNFGRVRFNASARFDKTAFLSGTSFRNAQFNGAGNFRCAIFRQGANFDTVEFRHQSVSHARFSGAVFDEVASFERAQFSGHAEFDGTEFHGGAVFTHARFGERSDTESSESDTSTEEPHDAHSQADRRIDFSSAAFLCNAEGEVASFHGARFGDRNFVRAAIFNGATFGLRNAWSPNLGTIDFGQSQSSSDLSLRSAYVGAGIRTTFSDAHIEKDLDLTGAEFFDTTAFEKTKCRNLILADTTFNKVPDLRQASFVHPPRLYQAHLPDRIVLPRSEKRTIAPLLGALRKIATETNDKRTEAKILVHELRMDGGVASRLYGMISNYGQSWLRPVLWLMLFVFLIFPIAHLAVHKRLPTSQLEAHTAISNFGPACVDGKEGNALAAAIELSIKSSMIVGPDDEAGQKRVKECLGAPKTAGFRTAVLGAVLEALQVIVTGIFLFFIGGSVRRRFQMR